MKVAKSLKFKQDVPSGFRELQQAVGHGVTYVSIYANQNFMNYKSGIFSDPRCSDDVTNHAVAVVGYDADMTYWKVRNSWGSNWGEQGYIRMQFSYGNHGPCNIYKRNGVVVDAAPYG